MAIAATTTASTHRITAVADTTQRGSLVIGAAVGVVLAVASLGLVRAQVIDVEDAVAVVVAVGIAVGVGRAAEVMRRLRVGGVIRPGVADGRGRFTGPTAGGSEGEREDQGEPGGGHGADGMTRGPGCIVAGWGTLRSRRW